MHISLIGLPGSGKSTIGKHLARQWRLPLIDSDTAIEQHLGCSIKSYFASHGEAAFRDAESLILGQLLQAPTPSLIATGGGAILRAENRAVLRAYSTVFYLQSPPEEIAQRLHHDTTRPLIQGQDALQRLLSLRAEREPLYLDTAHYVIDTARCSTAQVARKIAMQADMAGLIPTQPCTTKP